MLFEKEVKKTRHFNERVAERFAVAEGITEKQLSKTIQKASEKAQPGQKFKYTHPLYNITVVIRKIGRHGADLITCWREGVI